MRQCAIKGVGGGCYWDVGVCVSGILHSGLAAVIIAYCTGFILEFSLMKEGGREGRREGEGGEGKGGEGRKLSESI